jgi:mono/diheme cytochrome c family protein
MSIVITFTREIIRKIVVNRRNIAKPIISILPILILAACSRTAINPLDEYDEVFPATITELPEAESGVSLTKEEIARGYYLVSLLRCGACHTDGALIGKPDPARLLAGSAIGIAYTNPLENDYPGVAFPANLTPDDRTGLGQWTKQQIADLIRTGSDRHGSRKLSIMPYPAYSNISDEDALAIAAYLGSLKAVRHDVPENVRKGSKTSKLFVHFGVYRSKQ